MDDQPRFPSPTKTARHESAYRQRSLPSSSPPSKPVVTRAEPLLESTRPKGGGRPQAFTPEELRALVAVGANRSALELLRTRGRITVVPIALLSLAGYFVFESAAPWLTTVSVLIAIVWTGWPLFRRDGWS